MLKDYDLTLVYWSRISLAQKCRPEMWALRGALAAVTDKEWISVVSYSLPTWLPPKTTIWISALQKPAQKGLLILIKFDILMNLKQR